MSILTIGGDITVQVSTFGAELQSIRDKNGVERLWQGDPAFWANRAPILFPIAGGLKEDAYILDGVRYGMPKHGFAKKIEWQEESKTACFATFVTREKHAGFPFDYALRARYTVSGSALLVEYIVRNEGARDFCFGIGAHEAYATPEGIEAYEIVFDETETLRDYELVGNLIKREPIIKAESTRVFPLRYADFAVDALVFQGLRSKGVTLRSRLHDRTVRVDYPDCDVFMLWTKPNAPYICIEPWRNAPDYLDADMDIRQKPGIVCLQPGEESVTRHTITIG